MNKELRDAIKVIENLCGEIELVSYGLAPNPNGFSYEVFGSNIEPKRLSELDLTLDHLSNDNTETIKELYLR